jgi:phosphopantothenoylcysteine decarboxylase/phosphopantothenate--cysteine ligase
MMTFITGCQSQSQKISSYQSLTANMLQGRKILVGLTASIAAYKTATIVRLLVRDGAEVQVIMTPMAREFITPVTLSALSGNPVHIDFFSGHDGRWDSHVDLGIWAELFLIAPVTASTLGKMASGIADNLLLTTYLSCKCPVILAPAMDLDMYRHPSTTRNLEILQSYGNQIIEPASGELASGLYGKGRMEEPETILEKVHSFFGTDG